MSCGWTETPGHWPLLANAPESGLGGLAVGPCRAAAFGDGSGWG